MVETFKERRESRQQCISVQLTHARALCIEDGAPEVPALDKQADDGSELSRVFRRCENSATSKRLRDVGARVRYHWDVEEHRLDERNPETLVLAHADEDVSGTIQSVEFLGWDVANEFDAVNDAVAGRKTDQVMNVVGLRIV